MSEKSLFEATGPEGTGERTVRTAELVTVLLRALVPGLLSYQGLFDAIQAERKEIAGRYPERTPMQGMSGPDHIRMKALDDLADALGMSRE